MTDDKRRTDACLKACEGISTQNLEDNAPFLELARQYNVVLRERDALRAELATAQPAPGVPNVPAKSLKPVIDWLRNGCDPQEAAKELEILIGAALKPGAKP